MPAKAKGKYDAKADAERLGKVVKSFGEAISEIFEDPEVRKKAKDFSQSVVDAAARVVESKIRHEEAKKKFRDAGRAVQSLGKTLVEHFTAEQ